LCEVAGGRGRGAGAGGAMARGRMGEYAGARRRREPVREVAPQRRRAEPFVQHHDGRRRVGRAYEAVFEASIADVEEAGGGEHGYLNATSTAQRLPPPLAGESGEAEATGACASGFPPLQLSPASGGESPTALRSLHYFPCASISRSLKRWIFPVAVFGRLSSTSIQRGYFHGPTVVFTCSRSAALRSSLGLASLRTT